MSRPRLLIPVLLALAACPSESTEPPPSVAAPLGPGEVRAGRIEGPEGLLGGPNANARVSDFKIYNQRVAFTIAAARAAEGFHPYGGSILDADVVRAPGALGASAFGEIIWSLDFAVLQTDSVEVISDGRDGAARVRARGGLGPLPLYDALLGGLFGSEASGLEWQIDYVLEPDADVLRIEHEIFNPGRTEVEASPLVGFFFGTGARPFFEGIGFRSSNSGTSSEYYAAASDEVSYLFAQPDVGVSAIFGESGIAVCNVGSVIRVRARERKRHVQHLWVGDGDLAATRARWRASLGRPTRTVEGLVRDEANNPVPWAHVHVLDPEATGDGYLTRGVADARGRFRLDLDPAPRQLVATTEDGRISAAATAEPDMQLTLPSVATVTFDIRDEAGAALPAKVSLRRMEDSTPSIPALYGEALRPDGFDRVIFAIPTENQARLPEGTYTYYISRGIEYEVVEGTVEVRSGEAPTVAATLERSVDSPGWMTSDPHIHAQASSDSSDSYELKVRALAAENIELPVSTDHDAVGDFNPAIAAAGLGPWLRGVVGTEISTTRYGHFNAYPIDQAPRRIDWYGKDPAGFFETAHALPGQPVVQVNHPRSSSIGYFELMGMDRETFEGDADLTFGFDGIEVINECGDGALDRAEVLDWFAFLSRGDRYFATGTMDDHTAQRGRLGVPLTYVAVDAAAPDAVSPEAFRDAHARGELVVTCGPFIDATVQGGRIGSIASIRDGRVEAEVTVSAAGWVDVDEVLLIIGGEVRARADVAPSGGGVRFTGTLSATVTPGRDTWAIVWARGDAPHGAWAQARPSFGFTNAVFLDGDGDGAYF